MISRFQYQDDFFYLGGDSLSALAVTKRLLEWDGVGRWPEDGIVDGPLALSYLQQFSTLQTYSDHLEQAGINTNWTIKIDPHNWKVHSEEIGHARASQHRRDDTDCLSSEDEIGSAGASLDKDSLASSIASARALRDASARGDLPIVLALLAASADPNGALHPTPAESEPPAATPAERREVACSGVPPLHAAANQGRHEVRRHLPRRGKE